MTTFEKEIVGIENDRMICAGMKNWAYRLTPYSNVSSETKALLQTRQKEKWQPLGIAVFETTTEKFFSLKQILL